MAPETAGERASGLVAVSLRHSQYRADIDGLRALAIGLVALYHYTQNGVSGGVDIFLLISGYLVLGSLLRRISREGTFGLIARWRSSAVRLVPPAWLMIIAVSVGAVMLTPSSRWRGMASQVIPSAGYYENVWLARHSIHYGSESIYTNPFQHLWSLSVQGQIFLIAPLVMVGLAWFTRKLPPRARAIALAAVTASLMTASFIYAVRYTNVNQPKAYYSTPARLWEFLLGALLALAIPYVRMSTAIAIALSWLGLTGVLLTGILIDGINRFPGPVTLVPLLSACLLIVAGVTPARWGANRLLSLRPIAAAGAYAYGFYLWHWPVLVLFMLHFDRTSVGPRSIVFLLVLSGALALATHWIARPRGGDARGRRVLRLSRLRLVAVAMIPLLAAAVMVERANNRDVAQALERERAALLNRDLYPGALTLLYPDRFPTAPDVRPIPEVVVNGAVTQPVDGSVDKAPDQHCDVPGFESEPPCTFDAVYGDSSASLSIAVVGGSHAGQWGNGLDVIGMERGVKIRTFARGSCPFVLSALDVPWWEADAGERCITWNELVLQRLTEDPPDYVFTNSTRAQDAPSGARTGSGEWVPQQYVEGFRALGALGIPVIGMRDSASFPSRRADCVERYGPPATECTVPKSEVHGSDSLLASTDFPDTVHVIDLSDLWCPDGQCPAIIGNILPYVDSTHITGPFVASMAPALDAEIGRVTGWWPPAIDVRHGQPA